MTEKTKSKSKNNEESQSEVFPLFIQRIYLTGLDPIVNFFIRFGVHPNTFTFVGLFLNFIGAFFLAMNSLAIGGFFIIIGGICDTLDGKIARASGLGSKFGALLDSSLDRYSEVIMFLGIAIYFVKNDFYFTSVGVFFALGGSMMVSYIRARAEGLGYNCRVGIMQRAERIVVIGLGALLSIFFSHWMLAISIWVVAVMATVTAIQRVMYIYNLDKQLEN